MSSSYKILVPVSQEPITLADAKLNLRVDFSDDDSVISDIISRARSTCEVVTARAWAAQTIQQIFIIERPVGGELSGPIAPGANWYQFDEQLGANPFGPSQYYFDLAMPPVQASQPYTVQTKITAFDAWTNFSLTSDDGTTVTWLDDTSEPARLYFRNPVTANFWKFQFVAGYDPVVYPLPFDLRQCLMEGIAYFYEFREAQDFPDALKLKLLARRADWV